MSERSDFYVYALFREDGTPFYIGKGRDDRWSCHERRVRAGRSHKDNIIVGMQQRGVAVPKVKLAEGLTDAAARDLEVRLIAEFGRHPDGPLVNQTAGGEGMADPNPEARARMAEAMRKRWESAEYRESLLPKLRAQEFSPERRANISAGLVGRQLSAETKEKVATAKRGRRLTEAHREAIGAGNRGKPHSAERRAKVAEALRGRKRTPHSEEHKARVSATLRGRPKSDAHKEALRAAAKRRVQQRDAAGRYAEPVIPEI